MDSPFDALGAQEKELFWIEESNQRFYAYNYFGQHPERLVGWFDKHMGETDESQRSTPHSPIRMTSNSV